jgi:serine/threonine protein kinase
MPLSAGTKLGSYEVVAQIGAGGMGEVYQAHDTKLGRDVAIKVLPEAVAHDAERLSRFQREAKMLAALNHPNIATIFGLEQSGGTHYLVMELVPGDTLQQRVQRDGAVPIEEALAIAKQIAEALEAAHEKGIIHRDLKPANVKVTPEGKVKVLDFGLAKAFEGGPSSVDMSNSPTLSQAATMQGVILGTAAYMSPEQARGRAVDKRTDIWAFGCVLYELLTGRQAFHGEDITEILASVVKSEPDWTALPANISPSIRVLLQRCLQNDKTLRMQAAGDVRIEIHEALSIPGTAGPTAAVKGIHESGLRWLIVGVGALLLVAAIASLATWNLKPSSPYRRANGSRGWTSRLWLFHPTGATSPMSPPRAAANKSICARWTVWKLGPFPAQREL